MTLQIAGLVTGLLFGYLLQRTEMIRYERQVGAVRLMDFTIMKFMMSSVLTGLISVFILNEAGVLSLSVKATVLGNNIIGGLIFGLGWGILGYCPGTAAGALGEGRIDALWGMLGMVAGSWVFAEFYPYTKSGIFVMGDYGKISLIHSMEMSPVFVVVTAVVILAGILWALSWLGEE